MNFQSSVLTGQFTALHTLSPSLSLPPSPLHPPLSPSSLHGTVAFLIMNNYLANWEILFKEPTDHSCLFLFWARWTHSTISHCVSLRFVWIVPSHLCLGLPSVPLPSYFPNKVYMHISYLCVLYNLPISLCLILNILMITGDWYKLWSSAMYNFFICPVTSNHLRSKCPPEHSVVSLS